MSRNNENSSHILICIALALTLLLGTGGYFYLAHKPSSQSAGQRGQMDFEAQLASLDPESRRVASSMLQLSSTFEEIADEASRLGQSNAQAGTADIVSRIRSATQMQHSTEARPVVANGQSTNMQCFTAHFEQQHSRMFREVYAAAIRIGGREQQQIQSAIRQFSDTQTRSISGVSSSYID